MKMTVDAIYENGILRPSTPLPLPNNARVVVTISNDIALRQDSERAAWLKLSQKGSPGPGTTLTMMCSMSFSKHDVVLVVFYFFAAS
jgi:predicted DNA-binding antitoxin AbrB/MazE fold protein